MGWDLNLTFVPPANIKGEFLIYDCNQEPFGSRDVLLISFTQFRNVKSESIARQWNANVLAFQQPVSVQLSKQTIVLFTWSSCSWSYLYMNILGLCPSHCPQGGWLYFMFCCWASRIPTLPVVWLSCSLNIFCTICLSLYNSKNN